MNTQTEHTTSTGIIELLRKARRKQLDAKPDEDSGIAWVELPNYLSEDEKEILFDGIEAVSQAEEPDIQNEELCLQLSKAHGELRPLVRFLLGCTFREKLAAVAMDILCYGDIEAALGDGNLHLYNGEIGNDLTQDWRSDVFRAVEEETGTPVERTVAAYLAGLCAAK